MYTWVNLYSKSVFRNYW